MAYNFVFETNSETGAYCQEIAQVMVALFEISYEEAVEISAAHLKL
jgi:hypothetical protein